jgi:hypothetical protein
MLTCAECGAQMARVMKSLPQGKATCQPCRRRLRSERGPTPPPPSRSMACALCGKTMHRGGTSLPEGQAMCLPCRRKRRTRLPTEKARGWTPAHLECPICRVVFVQDVWNQVYCSAACRESRRRWTAPKAPAAQRGYGKAHRIARQRWAVIVDAGAATCCLCGWGIDPGSKWHLDNTPDRTGYRGVAHAVCNIRDGARRGRSRQAS